MAYKILVDKVAIKEMFDFFYDAFTDISDESPEFYASFSKEYDSIMIKIME